MNSFLFAWRFGWPFLRKYKIRLFWGIGLGIVFGLSNALFIFAMKSLFERLTPEPVPAAALVQEAPPVHKKTGIVPVAWENYLKEKTAPARVWGGRTADALLPRWGTPLTTTQITGLILLLPGLALMRGGLGYAGSYFMKWVSERMLNDMRFFMVKKINSLSVDYFNRSKTGDLTKRINSDTDAIYYFVNLGVTDLVKEPTTLLGIFISLAWLDWQLLLATLLILPATVLPMGILGRKVRKASKSKNKTEVKFSSLLVEMIANIRMIKAFSLQELMENRFFRFRSEMIGYNMRMAKATEMINPLVEVFASLGIGIILVFVFFTHREVSDLVGFLTGIAFAASPLKKLTKVHLFCQNARISIERLQETMNEKPSVTEPTHPLPFPGFQREIRLDNVSFAYKDNQVLRNFNLVIRRGEKIGLAGESGSGKSTLVNLLFRFYDPTVGSISVDGLSLKDISTTDLRTQMALVSQEVLLFDDTVSANIALGRVGATQEEVEQAARAAHAHNFILEMPEGYQTRIGERGVSLSGGQRQRLSIARAFVRNAPILILDEATAALDSASEAEVQKAIDELAEHRTVIMVAHRLSTLKLCDRILVLDKGCLVEEGSFDDLLRKKALFASLAARQGMSL